MAITAPSCNPLMLVAGTYTALTISESSPTQHLAFNQTEFMARRSL